MTSDLFRLGDDRVNGLKLRECSTQQYDEIVVGDAATLDQRSDAGMICVGKKSPPGSPLSIEIGARCCERNHAEGLFVEFNIQGVRTLTHPYSPLSQLVQPQLPLHTFELLTDGTSNELIALCRVFHEPGR